MPNHHHFGLTVPQTWYLGWGGVVAMAGATWKDDRLAVFVNPSSTSALPVALSPSQRYVVVGDVWLSDRKPLLALLPNREADLLACELSCDLQWVATAWEQKGIDTFSQLIGIFGLAIWDRERQVLWLGRDRTGGRTLYYTSQGTTRWIAPNLRSLKNYHSTELDLVALRDYFCCAFVPGERTMWQDVRELRPGTILSLPDGQVQHYGQLPELLESTLSHGNQDETKEQASLEGYGYQLREQLDQVVQDYLPTSDVGIFLSGGLDSSAVTALTALFHSQTVHTYSIHFGEPFPNELAFSSLVANHCGTQHHILEIPLRQMWKQLPETMIYLDDPIGDPLTVPNLLLARLARETVGVVLNGEGGDPCFGGPKNQPMLINQLYGTVTGQDPLQAYLLAFQKCASDLPQLLQPEVWKTVKEEPYLFSEELNSKASYLNRLMALNIKYKGADQILTKVNNLTQAAGIEGRSPLFDQRIVELSMQIPPEYKLSGVQEKAVLKQAIADLLPQSILQRPKSGMMVPVQWGFQHEWQREAKKLLLNRKAAIAPYLNQALIRDWLSYRGDTWQRYGVKLWLLVSLELWLQGNGK